MRGYKILVILAVVVAVLLWRADVLSAFNPQPEPPGKWMPTLTPQDGARVNLAYLPPDQSMARAPMCVGAIEFRSLLDGALLLRKPFSLSSGAGASIDTLYEELLRNISAAQLIANGDIPLRIEVSSSTPVGLHAALELHDGAMTMTRVHLR